MLKKQMTGQELDRFRASLHKRRFFVGMLPESATSKDLEDHFKVYGPIESAYIIQNEKTSHGRKFGYVIFKSEEVLNSNILGVTHQIKGKKVIVDIFKGKNSAQNAHVSPGLLQPSVSSEEFGFSPSLTDQYPHHPL